jgi:hypothetical protein
MNIGSGRTFGVVVLSAALTVGVGLSGCKSTPPATTPPAQGVQGTMSPNGTFTPAPNQPASQQAAAAPSQAPAPAQTPAGQAAPVGAPDAGQGAPAMTAAGPEQALPPPPPVVRRLPTGTSIPVRITETLSAKQNDVGDRFTGVIAQNVAVGGTTMLKTGTKVTGRVIAAKGQGKFKGEGALGIELTSIAGVPVTSSEYEAVVKGKGKRTAGFIGGGAGGGALIGGIAGGGKGALIGGLVGAGAGTVAGAYTGNKDVVIASETLVRFKLTGPVTLP